MNAFAVVARLQIPNINNTKIICLDENNLDIFFLSENIKISHLSDIEIKKLNN